MWPDDAGGAAITAVALEVPWDVLGTVYGDIQSAMDSMCEGCNRPGSVTTSRSVTTSWTAPGVAGGAVAAGSV